MSDSDKLRMIKIEGYTLIDDWTLEQIESAQLNKRMIKFKNDCDSYGYQYIGIIFDDKTIAYGIIISDGDAPNEASIHWVDGDDGIDYKAAYQMGLITTARYEEIDSVIKNAKIDSKRKQVERLQQELREMGGF